MSQRDLSRNMGVAPGRVNYCLSGLTEKGFIKLENFKGAKSHLRYAYILTPSGFEEKLRLTSNPDMPTTKGGLKAFFCPRKVPSKSQKQAFFDHMPYNNKHLSGSDPAFRRAKRC